MGRFFIMILDSLGIGSAPDAEKFGDKGANTLCNIARECSKGNANDGRQGILNIPNLSYLGLGEAAKQSSGVFPIGLKKGKIVGAYSYASEISSGKDTVSGHWEMVGVPVFSEWTTFKRKKNSFPKTLTEKILSPFHLSGFLGNCHASGTKILEDIGEEHIKTGKPIFYTSSDSVFQIASHENIFGLKNLYQLCHETRKILDYCDYNVGRVIARPFLGKKRGHFFRTENRRDYSKKPPHETVLEKFIKSKNGTVVSIGKIFDIYSGVGITKQIRATGTKNLFDFSLKEIKLAKENTIILTNFSDFDSLYGHRRDVSGYAKSLEEFDLRLPELLSLIKNGDILIITADHGCDPTWLGTDHTRENVPILVYSSLVKPGLNLGHRKTLSDIGQTVASYFKMEPIKYGKTLVNDL